MKGALRLASQVDLSHDTERFLSPWVRIAIAIPRMATPSLQKSAREPWIRLGRPGYPRQAFLKVHRHFRCKRLQGAAVTEDGNVAVGSGRPGMI